MSVEPERPAGAEVLRRGADPRSGWSPATTETNYNTLHPGDRLRVKDNGRAAVLWTDNTVIRMDRGFELEVPESAEKSLVARLRKGIAYFFHRDKPGTVRVETSTVALAVRGTEFSVEVAEDGSAQVNVIEGEVIMSNERFTLPLKKGEGGLAQVDKTLRGPVAIDATNIVQWCLYYPGVLSLDDLRLGPQEQQALSDSINAYRAGDLAGALARYPNEHQPATGDERIYLAALWLSVGQVDRCMDQLDRLSLRPGTEDRLSRLAEALRLVIAAVKHERRDRTLAPILATEWLAESYFQQSRVSESEGERRPAWEQQHYGKRTSADQPLRNALIAARIASTNAPDWDFAWVRRAELEFSFGEIQSADRSLDRVIKPALLNAQAFALKGFLAAARNHWDEARDSFKQAIQLDGGLGNGWLGLGLVEIRQGRIAEGEMDLLMAAAVEPGRSLLRSYLGKAYGDIGDTQRANRELDLAKGLDQADPTPWLYSGLLKEQQSRINQGIGDLEKSQELNKNRSLFRSQFLLDQDRAVRSANLAQMYQHVGMAQVAAREATRAVESEYGNASAHLFLANAYDALRDPTRIELRYETPWFHELLLANLLSPVGGGRLSQFVSQQEYSKLLEVDGVGASILNEWRSDSELRTTASLFGTYGRTSFGLDVFYRNDDGDRPNSDDRRVEIYGQFKQEVTPNDIFYFLGKWQNQKSGDTFKTYDNLPLSAGTRFEETQAPGLLLAGWNHQWGPGANTLFLGGRLSAEQTLSNPRANQLLLLRDSTALQNVMLPPVTRGPDNASLVYSPALLEAIAPFLGTGDVTNVRGAPFDFYTQRRFEIYSAELQHIQQLDRTTLIFGGRLQEGEFETDARLINLSSTTNGGFSSPAAEQHSNTDFERFSLYAYDFWNLAPWLPWLTLIGGASWDRIEHPDNFRNPPVTDGERKDEQLSGKIGFTLSPSRWFTMRGVYTKALGGVTFDESVTLEPVQLAGFNQAYRTVLSESIAGSVETPEFTIWGLSVEGTLPSHTWWGARFNVFEQDVERTRGAFTGYLLRVPIRPAYFPDSTPERLAYREQSFEATINQLLGGEFAVGTLYRVTKSELRTTFPEIPTTLTPAADVKDEATLHELSLFCNWNSPSGLFARVEANWYSQHLADDPSKLPRPGDEFWQLNALLAYRFNRNRAEISVGVLNINNADYHLSPLNPYGDFPRERTAVVRCRVAL